MEIKQIKQKSIHYRKQLLHYIKKANAGHTGGDLSCIDILNVLYNQILHVSPESFANPNRDRYIQSKGHSVEALYVVLADCGFFPEDDLDTLCQYHSPYVGHPTRKVHGIEHNTGALGHGLSVSVGLALAAKLDQRDYRVYCLLGDGELAEGSNWEAVLSASHYQLDNLIAIVDHNQLQITGNTRDVCNTDPLAEKFSAFGWQVRQVDGHDIAALIDCLEQPPKLQCPHVVIAHTIKGKGISFMENDKKWHHRVPSDAQFERAMNELNAAAYALSK